ncbi:MAG: PIG-L family deacetylase [Actinobacteria bacterium]|nr:PIG-L family deacetylase [Actinomycetota bacterium]
MNISRVFLRKIPLILIVILVIIIVFPLLFISIASRIITYLSTPSDLKKAKKLGEKLAETRNSQIIVVVAHPDDVDWYAGGTLGRLHQNNNKITVVLGTSGEKGNNSTPNLGKIREEEQKEAGRILGYDEIIFLRFPDRGLQPDNKFKEELRKIFAKRKPDILFTFDIEKEGYIYHHSDHRAAGKAALEIVKEFEGIKKIYLFHSSAANVIFDISKTVDLKTNALNAHKSLASNTISRIFGFLPSFTRSNTRRYMYNSNPQIEKKTGIKYAEFFREEK